LLIFSLRHRLTKNPPAQILLSSNMKMTNHIHPSNRIGADGLVSYRPVAQMAEPEEELILTSGPRDKTLGTAYGSIIRTTSLSVP